MLSNKLIEAAAGAGGGAAEYIEDLFSTWLYTGNGATQTITNGIDLSGEGGLVWLKGRSTTYSHQLFDTERGVHNFIRSDTTDNEVGNSNTLTAFNSDGFDLGNYYFANENGSTCTSWTFRKAPGFFDVVTWTGNGTSQNISHNLGSVPGCIIVKRTDLASNWAVAHRGTSNYSSGTDGLNLDTTDAVYSGTAGGWWNSTGPTSTQFSVGNFSETNASGGTYVAYLFAHDEQIFGEGGDQSVIKCGSYTGTGSDNNFQNLGWEPQWVMLKRTDTVSNWNIIDNMRGWNTGSADEVLCANLSDQKTDLQYVDLTPTGFNVMGATSQVNASGGTYIYIAIRRGPMKTPTSGTEVFKADETAVSTRFSTGFAAVDLSIQKRQDLAGTQWFWASRLTGDTNASSSDSTAAEAATSSGAWEFDLSGQYEQNYVINPIMYLLRRAPGFFDVVAYTGTGVARTVSHNLGVAPELMIVKQRNGVNSWPVYSGFLANNQLLLLNSGNSAATFNLLWNNTSPTASVFSVGTDSYVNGNTSTYIAYLFATLPGISKVGSYTGTGTTLDIDCGFTSGARFVLIKRTDSTGDWYVWDTARGIVAGDDPYLLLNSTAAEVTNTDYIDPLSSGFQISSTAPSNINASGASFIFLAIT